MNSTTKALLRNAVIEAVNKEDDTAAMELLGILASNPALSKPALPPSLVESPQIIDGPARTYHYWSGVIRESFIPFMLNNGRSGFTSVELFSWIENNPSIHMTIGDNETRSDGSPYWRNIVSDALKSLKNQGVIQAQKGSKTYLIVSQPIGLLL